jgi:hypothetical protein
VSGDRRYASPYLARGGRIPVTYMGLQDHCSLIDVDKGSVDCTASNLSKESVTSRNQVVELFLVRRKRSSI